MNRYEDIAFERLHLIDEKDAQIKRLVDDLMQARRERDARDAKLAEQAMDDAREQAANEEDKRNQLRTP